MPPPSLLRISLSWPRFVVLFVLVVVALCGTCATEEHRRRETIVLAPVVLDMASRPEELPVLIDDGDAAPSPLAARVDLMSEGVGPGRAAAFALRLEGNTPGFSVLAAALGGRRAMVIPLDDERREMMLVAPVHLEERRAILALEVDGELADGTLVALNRGFEVTHVHYGRRELQVGSKFLRASPTKPPRARVQHRSLRAVLSAHSEERPWDGAFVHPTASAETAAFGTRRLLNGVQRSRHLGWDLDGRIGDPVRATQAGRVVLAARLFYSGGTVVLDHGQGLFSLYFHLSALDVRKGESVHRAQQVGRVGRSGRVTGPHLHFAFKLEGVYVDPERFLALPWPPNDDGAGAEIPVAEEAVRVTSGTSPRSRGRSSAFSSAPKQREPS